MAFSPACPESNCPFGDGSQILTGSRDKTARLWDVASGQEWERFDYHVKFMGSASSAEGVPSVCFAPDGKAIAIAYQHKPLIYILDTPTIEERLDWASPIEDWLPRIDQNMRRMYGLDSLLVN